MLDSIEVLGFFFNYSVLGVSSVCICYSLFLLRSCPLLGCWYIKSDMKERTKQEETFSICVLTLVLFLSYSVLAFKLIFID